MPTYQYRCPDCAHEFEVRQAFSEEPLTACPTDGCSGSVRKVFSGVGISFKGDGFYKNDHGSGSGARRSGSGSSDGDAKGTEKAPAGSSGSDAKAGSNGSGGTAGDGAGSNGSAKGSEKGSEKGDKATAGSGG